ncbi:hypothetical protein [Aureispira anguillae]|nr:hypothetical protein [Aureispira anguillae]
MFLSLALVSNIFANNNSILPFEHNSHPLNNEAADTYLLLAHKWENGKMYLDLNINGSFEGNLDGENLVYGNWEITNNQATLTLINDPIDEDEFKIEFTLSDVSFGSIKLVDKQGKALVFKIADN